MKISIGSHSYENPSHNRLGIFSWFKQRSRHVLIYCHRPFQVRFKDATGALVENNHKRYPIPQCTGAFNALALILMCLCFQVNAATCPYCSHQLQPAEQGSGDCPMCAEYLQATAKMDADIQAAAQEAGFNLAVHISHQPQIASDRETLKRLREAQILPARLQDIDDRAIPYAAFTEALYIIKHLRLINPNANLNYGRFTVGYGAGLALRLRTTRWEDVDYYKVFQSATRMLLEVGHHGSGVNTSPQFPAFMDKIKSSLELPNTDQYLTALDAKAHFSTDSAEFLGQLQQQLGHRGFFIFDIIGKEGDLITVVRSQQAPGTASIDYYILARPAVIISVESEQDRPTLSSLLNLMKKADDVADEVDFANFIKLMSAPQTLIPLLNQQGSFNNLPSALESLIQQLFAQPEGGALPNELANSIISHFTQNGVILPQNWQRKIKEELTSSGTFDQATMQFLCSAIFTKLGLDELMNLMSSTDTSPDAIAMAQAQIESLFSATQPAATPTAPEAVDSKTNVMALFVALIIRQMTANQ